MQLPIANLIATLEEQIDLYGKLAELLARSRSAYVAKDLEAIYLHLEAQAKLCDRLRELGQKTARMGQTVFDPLENTNPRSEHGSRPQELDSPGAPQLCKLLLDLRAVQQTVRRLNSEQSTFVNGSLRTLRVMTNALASFYPTYALPDSAPSLALPGVQP
jgi:hypothetical protein